MHLISSKDKVSVRLGRWTEIVGTLNNLSEDNHFLHLELDDKLVSFIQGSKEAEYILKQPIDKLLGLKVGLLRTDLPEKPILIRHIPVNGQQFSF